MRRIRFSLRVLILSVTAVGLFLGYSQHRRENIFKACRMLSDLGYIINVPNEWHDAIWQRKPSMGADFYSQNKELVELDVAHEEENKETIANLNALGTPIAKIREAIRREVQLREMRLRVERQRMEKELGIPERQ